MSPTSLLTQMMKAPSIQVDQGVLLERFIQSFDQQAARLARSMSSSSHRWTFAFLHTNVREDLGLTHRDCVRVAAALSTELHGIHGAESALIQQWLRDWSHLLRHEGVEQQRRLAMVWRVVDSLTQQKMESTAVL